jgi:chromosome segregation ATPase
MRTMANAAIVVTPEHFEATHAPVTCVVPDHLLENLTHIYNKATKKGVPMWGIAKVKPVMNLLLSIAIVGGGLVCVYKKLDILRRAVPPGESPRTWRRMISCTCNFFEGATRNSIQLRQDIAKAHEDVEKTRGEVQEAHVRETSLRQELAESGTSFDRMYAEFEKLGARYNELQHMHTASLSRWDNLLGSPQRDPPSDTSPEESKGKLARRFFKALADLGKLRGNLDDANSLTDGLHGQLQLAGNTISDLQQEVELLRKHLHETEADNTLLRSALPQSDGLQEVDGVRQGLESEWERAIHEQQLHEQSNRDQHQTQATIKEQKETIDQQNEILLKAEENVRKLQEDIISKNDALDQANKATMAQQDLLAQTKVALQKANEWIAQQEEHVRRRDEALEKLRSEGEAQQQLFDKTAQDLQEARSDVRSLQVVNEEEKELEEQQEAEFELQKEDLEAELARETTRCEMLEEKINALSKTIPGMRLVFDRKTCS